MISAGLSQLLAMMGPPPGTTQDPKGQLLGVAGPLIAMAVIFYFLLIRPQQKKQKEHAQLLKTVRAGDKILTNSGILAVVVTVKEKTLMVRSADSKFEIVKSAVGEITERSGDSSES